jgi:hypothetical protein
LFFLGKEDFVVYNSYHADDKDKSSVISRVNDFSVGAFTLKQKPLSMV